VEELRESRGSDNRRKQEFIQNLRRREDNMSIINKIWVLENVTEI
jgi:hypothetical protein